MTIPQSDDAVYFELRRQIIAAELGLSDDASWNDIGTCRAELRRQKNIAELGLPKHATAEDVRHFRVLKRCSATREQFFMKVRIRLGLPAPKHRY